MDFSTVEFSWMKELLGDEAEFASENSHSSSQSPPPLDDSKNKASYRRKKTVKAPRKRTFIANMEKVPHAQSESRSSSKGAGGNEAGGGALKRLSSSGSGSPPVSMTPAGGDAHSSSLITCKASPSPSVNPATAAVPATLPMVQPSFKTGAGFAFSRTQRINPMMMQPLYSADQWGVVTTEVKAPSIGIKRQAISTQMNQATVPRSLAPQPIGMPSYASAPTPLTTCNMSMVMAAAEQLTPAMSMHAKVMPEQVVIPSLIDHYIGSKPAALVYPGSASLASSGSDSLSEVHVNPLLFSEQKDDNELSDLFAAWCEDQEPKEEASKRRRLADAPVAGKNGNLLSSDTGASGWDVASFFEENHALFSSFEDADMHLDRLASDSNESYFAMTNV